jgi:hypothetical protein
MTIVLVWFALAIVVAVAAVRRFDRNGFGWFMLAIAISPLLAGVLLLALGRVQPQPADQLDVRADFRNVDWNVGTVVARAPLVVRRTPIVAPIILGVIIVGAGALFYVLVAIGAQ